MFYVMENKTDVIICEDISSVNHNEQCGFKLVGTRKTESGAQKLADKRCEITV